jgi:hypothetical protein
MKYRLPGFITGGVLVIVALGGLISIARLTDSQHAISRIAVLEERGRTRQLLARIEHALFLGDPTDVAEMTVIEPPAQSKFNLAALYDRLGPSGPVFIDRGQAAIFDRVILRCGLESLQRDDAVAWLKERPTEFGVLPIDGLVTVGLLDEDELTRAFACLRYDPAIYRTRILEVNADVLSAWLGLETRKAVDILARLAEQEPYNPHATRALLNYLTRAAGGDDTQIDELGFAAAPSLRTFVFIYKDSPFAIWTIGERGNKDRAVLSRRLFWNPNPSVTLNK